MLALLARQVPRQRLGRIDRLGDEERNETGEAGRLSLAKDHCVEKRSMEVMAE